jgi:hypothetical protein
MDKIDWTSTSSVLAEGGYQLKTQTQTQSLSMIPTSVIMNNAIKRKRQEQAQLESKMQKLKLTYQEYFDSRKKK